MTTPMLHEPAVSHRWPARVLLAGLLVLLGTGVLSLLRLPWGSAYPYYSTSRTDPSGTSLLFDALERSGQVKAIRNYLPPGQLHQTSATIVYLGLPLQPLLERRNPLIENALREAKAGHRVVLGFLPERVPSAGSPNHSGGKTAPARDPASTDAQELALPGVFLRRVAAQGDRPEHRELQPDAQWQALGLPKLWERRFGEGEIVLLDHADRLANRSVATMPEVQYALPQLIGDRRTVVFDEAHLGVAETGSIAALARRYRLGGLLFGLLLMAGLFLWKESVPFPPINKAATLTTLPLQTDKLGALAGLLERHMNQRSALEACIAEWNRVHPQRPLHPDEGKQGDPAATYRALTQALQPRKRASR